MKAAKLQTLFSNPAVQQRTGLYLNIILLLLIIITLIASLEGSKLPTSLTTVAPARAVSPPTSTISSIPNWHLFGMDVAGNVLPKTSLNLRLSGVFMDTNAKQSSAAISVSGAKEKIFTVGQQIMSGVALVKVLEDKIYINNQGRMEQLDLPRPMLQQLN